MIGHIARHPRVRDRALFVGNPDDIVPARFGPGLPCDPRVDGGALRFPGYISGFDPCALGRPRGAARTSSATGRTRRSAS
jgi:hypothetical protein